MSLTATLSILFGSIVVFLWARHKSSQPADPLKLRMVPYTGLVFVAAVVALYMIVHLVNMAGFETGRR